MHNNYGVHHYGRKPGNGELFDVLYEIQLEEAKKHDAWMTEQWIGMMIDSIGSEEDNLKRIC